MGTEQKKQPSLIREQLEPIPAQAFHPGEALKDELEARNLSIAEFCNQAGWPVSATKDFVNGKRRLTLEMCMDLSRVLGISRVFWANLWWSYCDWKMAQPWVEKPVEGDAK